VTRTASALGALALAAVLALTATGCGPAQRRGQDPVTGTQRHFVSVGGESRSYLLYRPAGLVGPAPLVVMLHGGFGSGEQAQRAYGWDRAADIGHFVVAYPDGRNRAWNTGGGCCGEPARTGVDDVAFVTAMVADIESRVRVDPRRRYVTGISNGGMLAYTLACRTDLFAAIGPDAATRIGPCDSPSPLSVIHLHGTADERIRFDGEPGTGVAAVDGPPVPDVIADWRAVNGCAPASSTTDAAVTTDTATCPAGREVRLVTIDGGGHEWAGASDALNATDVIWEFFSAHPDPA